MTSEQNMQHHPQTPAYDDEIDLVDLWLILLRRKWVVVFMFILTLVLAGAYLSLTKPVYESTARLMIGQVQEIGLLEESQALSYKLQKNFGKEARPDQTFLSEVKSEGKNNVELTVQGLQPDDVHELLEQIVDQVLREHEGYFQRITEPIHQKLFAIQKRSKLIDELMQGLDSTKDNLPDTLAALTLIERSRLYTELTDLEQEQLEISLRIDAINSYPTTILSGPGYPEHPVKPRTGLVMALSVVLGLMLGVFAAFGCEFMSNARERIRQDKNQ